MAVQRQLLRTPSSPKIVKVDVRDKQVYDILFHISNIRIDNKLSKQRES